MSRGPGSQQALQSRKRDRPCTGPLLTDGYVLCGAIYSSQGAAGSCSHPIRIEASSEACWLVLIHVSHLVAKKCLTLL